MSLRDVLAEQGAVFAPDGIPLHFGDQLAEYQAALNGVVVMDRSHEARLELTGKDRLDIIHRISTNDLTHMQPSEGRATIFTSAAARILDRVTVYHWPERAVVLGEPGRGAPLMQYLQRNIFFNDQVRIVDLSSETHALDLHGPGAQAVIESSAVGAVSQHSLTADINGVTVFAGQRKALAGTRWTLIVPKANAEPVWSALVERGARPAGSLTYNVLRIRAGMPGVGRELSQDYIPLEVGLWDEVSFTKGCYTGQEIIARMESRSRLASTLVRLELNQMVDAPADLYHEGHAAGKLTSSVITPDGEIFAMGVVKMKYAHPGQMLTVGQSGIAATVQQLLGAQPPFAQPETENQLN